jgi:hypothetical protein
VARRWLVHSSTSFATANRIRRPVTDRTEACRNSVAIRQTGWADGCVRCQWLAWLDGVPDDGRDEDATALQTAVEHFGVTGNNDRPELLITHNLVIGWSTGHQPWSASTTPGIGLRAREAGS